MSYTRPLCLTFSQFGSDQEAINLVEVVEKILDSAPAKSSELIDRPRILPPGGFFGHMSILSPLTEVQGRITSGQRRFQIPMSPTQA